jgi:uncharacterized ubiquitin-like protein YukD
LLFLKVTVFILHVKTKAYDLANFTKFSHPCGLPAITAANKNYKISSFLKESTIIRKMMKAEPQK